jgi:hypothetical protein
MAEKRHPIRIGCTGTDQNTEIMEEECFTPKQNILENKGGYQFGF